VEAARRDAPALLVDAGDALFHAPALAAGEAPAGEARARLVLSAMGRMGYAALAVGERDLALGPAWLAREAAAAGVPLLSANLAAPDGTHPFPGTRLVEAGGERVGLLAVAAAGDSPRPRRLRSPRRRPRRRGGAARERRDAGPRAPAHARGGCPRDPERGAGRGRSGARARRVAHRGVARGRDARHRRGRAGPLARDPRPVARHARRLGRRRRAAQGRGRARLDTPLDRPRAPPSRARDERGGPTSASRSPRDAGAPRERGGGAHEGEAHRAPLRRSSPTHARSATI
jgi:hypothetical protein